MRRPVVPADVDIVTLEGDYGEIESVEVACTRCGNTAESYGTSDASVRRSLALLSETCPRDEENFYEEAA